MSTSAHRHGPHRREPFRQRNGCRPARWTGHAAALSIRACPATVWPSGSSATASSKTTTPLHNRLQPCSGRAATTRAAARSEAFADGHCCWWWHMARLRVRGPVELVPSSSARDADHVIGAVPGPLHPFARPRVGSDGGGRGTIGPAYGPPTTAMLPLEVSAMGAVATMDLRDLAARVRVTAAGAVSPELHALWQQIPRRRTVRSRMRADLEPGLRRLLALHAVAEGCGLRWVEAPAERRALASLVALAENAQQRDPRLLGELAHWVGPDVLAAGTGIPPYALGPTGEAGHAGEFPLRDFG